MRTDFLVHWTGRDIATNRFLVTDAQRADYVQRLVDIVQSGLWMTQPGEEIDGRNGALITYEAQMTCFTEIRLTYAEIHTQRYGLLGIGVNRHFVLERFGGPVHYVRNHCTECVVGNIQAVLNELQKLSQSELVNHFSVNAAFVKGMSDKNTDNFLYLNEQEWRIVHTHAQVDMRNIRATGLPRPAFRIPLGVSDIRVVVFPDDRTRNLATSDSRLASLLPNSDGKNPVLLTVEECSEF